MHEEIEAMSVETTTAAQNIQATQTLYRAFAKKDFQAIIAACAPTVQWTDHLPKEAAAAGIHRGPGEVARYFKELGETFDFERFEPIDTLASGDRVVTVGRYAGRVIATGARFEGSWVHTGIMRDGKVLSWSAYHEFETLWGGFKK